MKVLHLCVADARGGAAIGAYRLHRAMVDAGVDSTMLVAQKYSNDPTVVPLFDKPIYSKYRHWLTLQLLKRHKTDNPILRSLNVIPSGAANIINSMRADIVQLHWINADTISIGEIAALNKPIVWKLPDMWPFSGAEHYMLPGEVKRYKEGYFRHNRPMHESGLDLNRWVWRYKSFRWRDTNMTIVCPSKWLADCARASALFSRYDVHNIPNPLNLELYQPRCQKDVRAEFGLPADRRLIMFGALNAVIDRRKGYHRLTAALLRLREMLDANTIELVVMGSDRGVPSEISGFRTHSLGKITEKIHVARAYCAADVFVLPTELDNLPNSIKEATACGIPCVGFDVGGMPDMIVHKETGYLAKPYDESDLGQGLHWVLEHVGPSLSKNVRLRAKELHDPNKCVASYLNVYKAILNERHVPKSTTSMPAAKKNNEELDHVD